MSRQFGPRFRQRSSQLPIGNRETLGNIVRKNVHTGQTVAVWQGPILGSPNSIPAIREKIWDSVNPGPPFLTGGSLASTKVVFPHFGVRDTGVYPTDLWHNINEKYWYEGGFADPLWIPNLDTESDSSYEAIGTIVNANLFPSLSGLGSKAYAKLRPSIAKAGVAVALAEARDIPRMLQTSARAFHTVYGGIRTGWNITTRDHRRSVIKREVKMAPKGAANHFLNHQFGWVPFLSDMHRIYGVYQNAAKLKSQIKRDNGQWTKRHRTDLKLEKDDLIYSRTDQKCCSPPGFYVDSCVVPGSILYTIRLQEFTEVWYEGKFKYYRPEFDDKVPWSNSAYGEIMRQMSLYGAQISPTVVWRATPWTWLVDWFSNAGDVIQRAEDWGTDQVVSQYMYLMHHHRRRFELRSRFTTKDGVDHDLTWYRSADIKRREGAGSPFDFNLTFDDLSLRQMAILGALGISRS